MKRKIPFMYVFEKYGHNLESFVEKYIHINESIINKNVENILDQDCILHDIPSNKYEWVGSRWKNLRNRYVKDLRKSVIRDYHEILGDLLLAIDYYDGEDQSLPDQELKNFYLAPIKEFNRIDAKRYIKKYNDQKYKKYIQAHLLDKVFEKTEAS